MYITSLPQAYYNAFQPHFPKCKLLSSSFANDTLLVKTDCLCLLQFKRELYRNFQYHFPRIKPIDGGECGYGQIMKRAILEKAVKCGVEKIVFIMPDGKIYFCYTMQFKNFVDKYNTELPYLKGEVAIPIEFFQRYEPALEVKLSQS